MENRRQSFRVAFPPEEAVRAELHKPEQRVVVPCQVLNLSLYGMQVRLDDASDAARVGNSLVVHLLGREGPLPVKLDLSRPARLIRLDRLEGVVHCAIQFLRTANVSTNETIERTLGRFLMAEQRRMRQRGEQPT
jgi:c-di-GMP-binding flagellar brake protein YcgR